MRMIGHGIDLVEIPRMADALLRRPKLAERIFTEGERGYFACRKNNPATIAGCFAAKEAAVKAVGCGFVRDVELSWNGGGKPSLTMRGFEDVDFSVSITHSGSYAAASVIATKR